MNTYVPYPTKTVAPPDHQGPRNLTAHLPCRLVQLRTKHKIKICSIVSKNINKIIIEAFRGDIMYH